MGDLQDLQMRLGLRFENEGLLWQALTHRSYVNEHLGEALDNERLEFLGDAVLAFVVGALVYRKFPELAEGNLTRLRSLLVNTVSLAELAQKFELSAALRLGKGETKNGGAARQALLSDAFEAVIGALYLDQGFEPTKIFIEKVFAPLADTLAQQAENLADTKSYFQEKAQAQFGKTPYYTLVRAEGPEHQKIFVMEARIGQEVFGEGRGASKQLAEQEAAREALQKLGWL